jgi:hypothetical protein
MNLTDFLEKWGRTLFEAPLAIPSRQGEPPELAEIRLALLDQVRIHSYRAGGRKVFPYDLVRVALVGVERSRSAAFHGAFFRKYLEQELRTALDKSDCRFPEALRVEVETSPALPGPGEAWMKIETMARHVAEGSCSPAARLVVMEGEATVVALELDRRVVYIGRTAEVYRAEGMRRRNDLIFAADTEINRTVSREHAHICFDESAGEYRLHNDRWYPLGGSGAGACATWIVRKGVSEPVHRGARGARLEHGDELRFGRAAVRFELV